MAEKVAKKRGRPIGSKNKVKVTEAKVIKVAKKRGRPAGSKNKATNTKVMFKATYDNAYTNIMLGGDTVYSNLINLYTLNPNFSFTEIIKWYDNNKELN